MSYSDVAWCPHTGLKRYFAIASRGEIKLNKIHQKSNTPTKTTNTPRSYRNVAICTKVENIKKIEWCRDRRQGDGLVIAAGTRTGKVTLVSFPNVSENNNDNNVVDNNNNNTNNNNFIPSMANINTSNKTTTLQSSPTPYLGKVTKIFVSKYRRSCVSLRWNPIKVFQVAAGYEKGRTDDGCLIWDIRQKKSQSSSTSSSSSSSRRSRSSYYSSSQQEMITQPVTSVGNGDMAMSLAWQPRKSSILAMGTGSKLLKIFDLRENNSKRSAAPGLSVEAHRLGIISVDFDHERVHCICTVGERDTHVKLWDMRRLTMPIVQLYTHSPSVVKARFHPTEQGVVALASRDDSIISLWNLKTHTASNIAFDKDDNSKLDSVNSNNTLNITNNTKKGTITFRKINNNLNNEDNINDDNIKKNKNRKNDDNKNNDNDDFTADSSNDSNDSDTDDSSSNHDTILSPSSMLLNKKRKGNSSVDEPDGMKNKNASNSNLHDQDNSPIETGKILFPYRSRKASLPGITSFCWLEEDGSTSYDNFNRILTCGYDGRLESMAMYNTSCTAISAIDNEIVFASNKNIYITATTPSNIAMERKLSGYNKKKNNIKTTVATTSRGNNINDISMEMKVLAQSGYSLDGLNNIKILKKVSSSSSSSPSSLLPLQNIWTWLQKCKELHRVPGKGVFSVLHGSGNIAGFNDGQREMAMKMCGWVGMKQMNLEFLKNIALENFDRAIALAILYGDITNAIFLLQQQHERYQQQLEETNGMEDVVEFDDDDDDAGDDHNGIARIGDPRARVIQPGVGLSQINNTKRKIIPISVRIALAGYPSIQTNGAGLWYEMANDIVNDLNDFPYVQWAFRVLLDSTFNELLSSGMGTTGGNDSSNNPTNNKGGPSNNTNNRRSINSSNFNPSPLNELGDGEEESSKFSSSLGTTISMTDRIALACRFLPKGKLINYLKRLYRFAEANSKIEGLILIGLMHKNPYSSQLMMKLIIGGKQNDGMDLNTNAIGMNSNSTTIDLNKKKRNIFIPDGGVQLLQKYVDKTGDVQTAALILSYTGNLQLLYGNPGKQFIFGYRNLLNRWEMYRERARFDCDRADIERYVGNKNNNNSNNSNANNKYVPKWIAKTQLSARCGSCNESFLIPTIIQNGKGSQPWLAREKNVIPACPSCKRGLPKCCICLLTLGSNNPYAILESKQQKRHNNLNSTSSGGGGGSSTSPKGRFASGLSPDEWMTWCVHCGHGGHALCMASWEHDVCPVNGCECTFCRS